MTVLLLAAEASNPLDYDPLEVVVGTLAFLVLFLVLRRTAFPRFERIYTERTERIDGGMARAEQLRGQAAGLRREYEEQVAVLRAEAASIRDEARTEGQVLKAELRAAAEAEVAHVRERGAEQIAAAREQVVQELHGELGGLSTELAERLVGGPLDAERPATVEAFLAELDGLAPGAGRRSPGSG